MHPKILQCGTTRLELGKRTLIMGVVNVTPDSFSDGGSFYSTDSAVAQALQLVGAQFDVDSPYVIEEMFLVLRAYDQRRFRLASIEALTSGPRRCLGLTFVAITH